MAVDAAQRIKEAVKKEGLEDAVKVKVTESGIAVKLSDPIGFDLGESEIKPELIPTLKNICEIVNSLPTTQIRVEGHTDDLPIRSYKFPSNWELSSSRALNVVKFMASDGRIEPSRLSAIGYGEYRPLVPNTSDENRKMNRRIEIFVDYLKKEN
jgi:chemotaxis protein MotB